MVNLWSPAAKNVIFFGPEWTKKTPASGDPAVQLEHIGTTNPAIAAPGNALQLTCGEKSSADPNQQCLFQKKGHANKMYQNIQIYRYTDQIHNIYQSNKVHQSARKCNMLTGDQAAKLG